MPKRGWFTLQIGLLIIIAIVATSFLDNSSEEVAQAQVFYAFTPEPTAAADLLINENTPEDIRERFTVSVAIPTTVLPSLEALVAPTAVPPTTRQKQEAKQVVQNRPMEIVDRDTFVRRFYSSRTTLSSLTYILNVADGDGILDCSQLVDYYERVTLFQQFDVAEPLQAANDYYIRSLNFATIGVNALYQWCFQQVSADDELEPVTVQDILPEAVFESAVAESNAALALNTLAAEWLDGSTRLLAEIYHQFEAQLTAYETAIATPLVEACPAIQQAYGQLAYRATHLDLGARSEFRSSYSKYTQAIQQVRDSGEGLNTYCDPAVGGAGQLTDANIQLLPLDITSAAQLGIESANELLDKAHFYISPDSLDATP